MSAQPRILDLFCGAGGAARGYQQAGFYVVGVDNRPQPRYAADEFVQADALEYLGDLPAGFSAIHASPPCQAHTTMSNRWRGKGGIADDRENLIPDTRRLLMRTGLPYVIENVIGARSELENTVVLSGGMFGLGVDRPRLFETNWPLLVPPRVPVRDPVGVYGKSHDGRLLFKRKNGTEQRAARSLEEGGAAMGVDWMEWRELAESIPPAYTELIGAQLMAHVRGRVVV